MRIEVCGNIAAGKSTFVNSFQTMGYDCFFENFDGIVSLKDFYANPNQFAFETEIAFTIQHFFYTKKASKVNKSILDFSLVSDYAFALTTLSKQELSVYEQLYKHIFSQITLPDLLVVLDAPENILMERIASRGRESEKSITIDYLSLLKCNLSKAIDKIYSKIPVYKIDTTEIAKEQYDKKFITEMLEII